MSELSLLVDALRELRISRGNPSLRILEDKSGVNRSTLSETLSGKRLPKWDTVREVVTALGGDIQEYRGLWSSAQRQATRDIVPTYSTEQDAISCFLSYAREDDDVLEFAQEIKKSLEFFAMSSRGRRLKVFLDRDDIEWGHDWHDKVRSGLLGAMIFMPVVTLRYFQRPQCREELLLFYENARQLDATELILPIVIFGHDAVSMESSDPVAQIIARHQYFDLQDAVLEGPQSATWRKAMLQVSNNLVARVDSASIGIGRPTHNGELESISGSLPGQQSDVGLIELFESAEGKAGQIASLASDYIEVFGELASVLNANTSKMKRASGTWSSRDFLLMASEVQPISMRASTISSELEAAAVEADGILRSAIDLLSSAGMVSEIEQLTRVIAASGQPNDFQNLEKQMNLLLVEMMPVEVMSVALRKALRPFRSSLKSVGSSFRVIDAWRDLESGGPAMPHNGFGSSLKR